MRKARDAEKIVQEKEVVKAAQLGDQEAFAELFDRYRERIYRRCLKMTGNESHAEDCLQEAFFQLWRKISSFEWRSSFYTWFYRLASNACLMYMRHEKVDPVGNHPLQLDDEIMVSEGAGEKNGKPAGVKLPPFIDKRAMLTPELIALDAAIEALPPDYKTVFHLHVVMGYEFKEIGSIVRQSTGCSKSRSQRACASIREMLQTGSSNGAKPRSSAARRALAAHA